MLSGLRQDMETPAKKSKKLSRVLNGLKKRLKGDSRTGQRLDKGIESARSRNAAVEAISEAEIVPGTSEPVPNALKQPERREYLPQQAPSAPIRLPQRAAFSVQPSTALPAPSDVRWGEESFTSNGTEKQSKQKVSDTPDNEEDSCAQEDTEDATKQRAAGSGPGPSRPTETAAILDKQLKDDDGRDTDGSSLGDIAHTDSTGKTSYLSAPVKNTYTTPGYEWASKSQGYDWTSRRQHYGYDNPTMSEAYQRELGRREERLAYTQEKVQKMKEDAIGEESKEPGIKMGYMYHA